MEVLDLSHNKISDYYEVVQLKTLARKDCIVAVSGNNFFNKGFEDEANIVSDVETVEFIQQHSKFF